MKLKLSASVSLIMLTLASPDALCEAGWTGYAHVSELTSTNQPYFIVTLKDSENPSGCRNKETFYLDSNSRGAEQMFRILLEALTSGKMVRLYVTGNCEINGYSEISEVSVTP